jgi:formylglycine-generating enzyme required for sulfatase activity
VGRFRANAFGLHDLHGNVWEWVQDVWHDSYAGAPSDGSAWMSGGDPSRRVLRGGSWNYTPQYLRSAYRDWSAPGYRGGDAGFRIARTL